MRLFLLYFGIAALASAYPESRSENHELTQESLLEFQRIALGQQTLMDTTVTKLASIFDFRIYFYTRKNRNRPVVVLNNDVISVVNSGLFNSSARTISITHGWKNGYKSECNSELIEAILETHDVNILVSDWSSIASQNYFTAKNAIPEIGYYLGTFINDLVSTTNISHKQFTLIGHSLGAHIAGAAGSNTDKKVDVIIGLDPAFPFISYDVNSRLDPSDADFVQVIHTCGGFLGFYDPIGHTDYYPNGGEHFQPGCILTSCSHGRSYNYLADSITNSQQKYWAFKCDTYSSFNNGECYNTDTISFLGTLEPDRSAKGSYWLKTNSKAPFALDYNP